MNVIISFRVFYLAEKKRKISTRNLSPYSQTAEMQIDISHFVCKNFAFCLSKNIKWTQTVFGEERIKSFIKRSVNSFKTVEYSYIRR